MLNRVETGARAVLEAVPLVMRTIRAVFRAQRGTDLSLPQFRALNHIGHKGGASLSDVAEHLGLGLPSTSKLIDGLVERKLVVRLSDKGDRRRVCLTITPRGREKVDAAHRHTETFLVEKLDDLSNGELETVMAAMNILQKLFGSASEPVIPAES